MICVDYFRFILPSKAQVFSQKRPEHCPMVHTTKGGAVHFSEEPSTGVYYQWRLALKLLWSLETDQVSWGMYSTTRIDLLDAVHL